MELTAKSVQGLADIGIYKRLMITVIIIAIGKVSGFPDIGFIVYLLQISLIKLLSLVCIIHITSPELPPMAIGSAVLLSCLSVCITII